MDLDSAVSRLSNSDYLFVLMYANARTGVRIGEEGCKVIGVYGRDTRVNDSNGISLLLFEGDSKLALVNTFLSIPKRCTSRTFNGIRPADKKRLANSLVIENSEPPQGARVLTYEQRRLTPTEANG